MSFIYYALLSIPICWKWGNWRNWKAYYPTIVFLIMGNLVYMVLADSKPLWQAGGILAKYPIWDISAMMVLYASTVILYLSFYDRIKSSRRKTIAYIVIWIVVYSAMELVSHITGQYNYYNGWVFFYSVIFNCLMFPILLLHYHKPLWAWLVCIILMYATLFIFAIPFGIN